MMPTPRLVNSPPMFRHEYCSIVRPVPSEAESPEFRQVRPNEPLLEWRRLSIKAAKQAANEGNDQAREQRRPKIFNIQFGAPPGGELEHRSIDYPDEKTKRNQRDWKGKDLDEGSEHCVDQPKKQGHPEIGAGPAMDGDSWNYRSCCPNR